MGDEIPVGQLIGYARVSTAGQDLALQRDALGRAGCDRIYDDTGSGSVRHRPDLDACLDYLRARDTLVVWRLDRLGRSLRHLVETVNALAERGVAFASLHEGIDTTISTGRLVFRIFAALAEFERELIVERAAVGRAAARARGRVGGRPAKLSPAQVALARAWCEARDITVAEIARALGSAAAPSAGRSGRRPDGGGVRISGPAGPPSFAGSLEASIRSRLPPW